jgi:hypothetical protein
MEFLFHGVGRRLAASVRTRKELARGAGRPEANT